MSKTPDGPRAPDSAEQRAFDRLSDELEMADDREQDAPARPWEGKPCPVCGAIFERDHACKPGRYPDNAIPF